MSPQGQTGGQTGQGIMNQPPSMVSTKDLLYLTDMLSWNLNAAKKAHFFAEHCTIPEIKTTIENACKMHERHYNRILAHLNNQQTYM
ncbi:hypothetical protein [Gracilibacillus halotolerans]|nr:hypothetical protein [Gracilibacillus halotolerans]